MVFWNAFWSLQNVSLLTWCAKISEFVAFFTLLNATQTFPCHTFICFCQIKSCTTTETCIILLTSSTFRLALDALTIWVHVWSEFAFGTHTQSRCWTSLTVKISVSALKTFPTLQSIPICAGCASFGWIAWATQASSGTLNTWKIRTFWFVTREYEPKLTETYLSITCVSSLQ